MSIPFNPTSSLIIIRGDLEGSSDTLMLRLALDTGSSHTVVDSGALAAAGITFEPSARRLPMNTPTGTGSATQVTVPRFVALGLEREAFTLMTLQLPAQLRIDGILGIDFFRGQHLSIDFRQGLISLT